MPTPRPDNYQIMAAQARARFLTYDQAAIIAKSPVSSDDAFLYLPTLDRTARVDRATGETHWLRDGILTPVRPHELMVIFDYLCDARQDRSLCGRWKALANFGHQFHTGLLEAGASPLEAAIDQNPDSFRSACIDLGGVPFPNCDLGFTLPLFPDLPVSLSFWHSDEDFPPQLRWFWDENSLQFLRYETMHYAQGLVKNRLYALMSREN